jgi:hypothetical protein
MLQPEKIAIELGEDKMIVLTLTPFDTDADMDDLTTIHHHNLIGEILTCPALLNRIGNLLADSREILSRAKLDFDIFYAQKYEEVVKKHTSSYTNSRQRVVIEKPSSTEIDQLIIRTPEYKVKKNKIITLEKNHEILTSFYWAVKDKSDKVSKISDKLRPEEFEKEIIEETINSFQIKKAKKSIKNS